MTDGANREGLKIADFQRLYQQLAPEIRAIRTFPILFSQSDDQQMQQVANLTGGRAFDAKQQSLSQVFKKIRGYQ